MLKKKKNFYFNFLGFLIKKGKKNIAINVIKTAFIRSSSILRLPSYYILSRIFIKLNSYVELRNIKIRNRFHLIPFPIKFSRRSHLIAKWFLLAIKENKKTTSLVNKITEEILKLLRKNSTSYAYILKQNNEKKALLNRSNLHYRW